MAEPIEAVRLLLRVADLDTPYRPWYLRRAAAFLQSLLPERDYHRLRRLSTRLAAVTKEAERAADLGDWDRVQALAREAESMRAQLLAREDLLELSDAVYRASPVQISPFALALQGLTPHPVSGLEKLRDELVDDLARLEELDAPEAAFYAERRREYLGIHIAQEPESRMSFADREEVRRALREAIGAGDWRRAAHLAHTLARGTFPGRAGPRTIDPACTAALTAAFPSTAVERGQELGFLPVEVPAAPALGAYVTAGSTARPEIANHLPRPAAPDPNDPEPDLRPEGALREALDLLMGHAFVTSAGVRYLPPFVPETAMVETFPETEPDDRSPLLEELGLAGRRGRSRLELEVALQDHEARILGSMGLDDREYALVCIPFDIYLRLAPGYEWGQQQLWTHFDGYQVTRGLALRALVGGDVRYGGPGDLCGVAREYADPHVTSRFAVVRRLRLLRCAPLG